jgi:hypothetical protein
MADSDCWAVEPLRGALFLGANTRDILLFPVGLADRWVRVEKRANDVRSRLMVQTRNREKNLERRTATGRKFRIAPALSPGCLDKAGETSNTNSRPFVTSLNCSHLLPSVLMLRILHITYNSSSIMEGPCDTTAKLNFLSLHFSLLLEESATFF